MLDGSIDINTLLRKIGLETIATTEDPKRKLLRNTVIVAITLITLLTVGIGIMYAILSSAYNEIERVEAFDPKLERPEPVVVPPEKNAPINFLLLGSDSRDATTAEANVAGSKGFRSDAIMVAQVSEDRQHITFMSIMRDNWVPIQDHGNSKINAAVAYGGIPLAVNTVEHFIDARIDHVAIIDFESFKSLTDAVGGVTIHNDIAFVNQNGGNSSFEAGEITLDGTRALHFVRERYAFSDGDYQRARNQQTYMKGLLKKLLSKDTLTSPAKITNTFQALTPYLVLDESLDLNTAIGLGLELRDIRSESIEFFTSPTLGVGTSPDLQSIVLPNWQEIEFVRAAFRNGTLHEYASTLEAGSEAP